MPESHLGALLELVPNEQLEQAFGVDSETVGRAVVLTLSGLVSALEVETAHPAGSRDLDDALKRRVPSAVRGETPSIDVDEGRRIVEGVFGKRRERAVGVLVEKADDPVVAGLVPELLPMLAPILMQYLAAQRAGVPNDAHARSHTQDVLAQLFSGLTGEQRQSGSLEQLLGKLFRR